MQVDYDPLQIKDASYTNTLECLMVKTTKSPNIEMEVSESIYPKNVKAACPTAEEELVDFLICCKPKGS